MKRVLRSGNARRRLAALEQLRPHNEAELHVFVERVLELRVPRRPVVAGNDAPFEYLVHTFFEAGFAKPQAAAMGASADVVVWASRSGGKTMLGAAATMLDLLFKPGIQVRILAGSLEQASKMYEYLLGFAHKPMLRGVLAGEPTLRQLALINGSRVTVSAQSPRAIRGQHVHKLRCDEVDLLERKLWQAAQMVPLSGTVGGLKVRGAIEALSTMHQPFGIMNDLTQRTGGPRVLRWSALDVAERCPDSRPCAGCLIEHDCHGLAKQAAGYLSIEDLLALRERTSDDAWYAEMLCRRPRRDAMVYHNFSDAHLRPAGAARSGDLHVAGMDFGVRSPMVMLWAVLPAHAGDLYDQPVHVGGEYAEAGLTLEENLKRIFERGRCPRGSASIPPDDSATPRPASATCRSSAATATKSAPKARASTKASKPSAAGSTAAPCSSTPPARNSSRPCRPTTSTPNAPTATTR